MSTLREICFRTKRVSAWLCVTRRFSRHVRRVTTNTAIHHARAPHTLVRHLRGSDQYMYEFGRTLALVTSAAVAVTWALPTITSTASSGTDVVTYHNDI